MAIDFSQVKTITIPEGSVKKITDSNGNILWKEQSAEWRTIWEGNQKIGYGGQTNKFVFATEPYSDTLKIRVSFSSLYTWKNSGDEGYSSYIPTDRRSPATYTSFSVNTTTLVMAGSYNTTRDANYRAVLTYDKRNGQIYGRVSRKNDGGNARAYIVITKIEAYS